MVNFETVFTDLIHPTWGSTFRRIATGVLAACLTAGCASVRPTTISTLDGRTLTPGVIDATVERLMGANDVKGLAVGLIRGGRVVYVHAYGMRDIENHLPLQTDTIMYGASLTKATFAYMVMQLVDEGRIDLDRPIADYLAKPLPEYQNYSDLAGDERWRRLTMRMLLNHTTGFANLRWLEDDHKLHFHRDPGARYGYSGEGLYLAQFVLQEGLHLNVRDEMQRRVFDRFGMTRSSLQWREDFAGNLAQGYGLNGAMTPHDHRDHVSAAGSLDTTIADWTNFLAGVARGEGLSPASRNEMIRLSVIIDSATQFPTLSENRADWSAIHLGYGVGWGVFETPSGHAFFKEGHNDQTANYALCVAARRDCIVLMSNSVRAEGIFVPLIESLFGPTNLPWAWEGYTPYNRTQ